MAVDLMRRTRRTFLILVFLLCAAVLPGCATYNPRPLPAAQNVAPLSNEGLDRLLVEASSLEHPLLAPLRVDFSDGLDPDEAAVLAVLANPDLKVLRDAHGEAAAQLVGAGLLPNPDFSAEVVHPRGAGSAGTVDATTLGLGLDLTAFFTRAGKVASASNALQAVDLGIAWQEWQVAQAARLATVRIGMLARRLALVRAEEEFERETVAVLDAAMAEGDATIQELGVHRSALENMKQLTGDLSLTQLEARSELNRLLNIDPDLLVKVTLPDPARDSIGLAPVDSLIARAFRGRLDLLALQFGYRSQEAKVRQAVAEQFPTLTIGVTRQRNESALQFLGGFVNLGLPFFNRNQGTVALERATRTRLLHEYEARIATIRGDVARLADTDAMLGAQIEDVSTGLLTLAEVEAAEHEGVLQGDVDRLVWQDTRSTLLDMRLKKAALEQARCEVRIGLQTALGSGSMVPFGAGGLVR